MRQIHPDGPLKKVGAQLNFKLRPEYVEMMDAIIINTPSIYTRHDLLRLWIAEDYNRVTGKKVEFGR